MILDSVRPNEEMHLHHEKPADGVFYVSPMGMASIETACMHIRGMDADALICFSRNVQY